MRRQIILILALVGALLAVPAVAQAHPSLEPRITALESAMATLQSQFGALDTYYVTTNVTLPDNGPNPDAVNMTTVACNSGDFVTGGGYRVGSNQIQNPTSYPTEFRIIHSFPWHAPNTAIGWTVATRNGTGNDMDLEVFAVCLDKP